MIVLESRASHIIETVARTLSDRRPFLLPVNICPIVPETLARAARRYEFVDIDATSLAADLAQCAALADRASAIIFVRPYGCDPEEEPLLSLRENGLVIIDDRCLCRPELQDGPPTAADVTLYSTGARKYVDLGRGGFAHVRNGLHAGSEAMAEDWTRYAAEVRNALVGADAIRAELNAIYAEEIPREAQLPGRVQRWRFNVAVNDPDALVAKIFEAGLFASRHYRPLASGFPVAARLHERIVNLFTDHNYDAARARRTAEIVRRHVDATS